MRLLLRQVADRLSVRWYVGYDLDEPLPDHSTLSKIRLRYGLEVFRRFFEAIVEQCQQARLVWGKELYFDSTQVNANADLDSLAPRFAVEARETIREYLAALFNPEPMLQENTEESSDDAPLPEPLPEDTTCPRPASLPVILSETGREELAEENAARHDWIAQEGRQQREVYGSYQRTADFRISTTDPDATPMRWQREEDSIWATTRTTSWTEANVGLSWRCSSCQAKSWTISRCSTSSGMSSSGGACGPNR